MRFFDYIGEVFLFRWLFGRGRKNGRQEMSEMSAPYHHNNHNNDVDFERYCDMDEADCFGHEDYDCHEDFLDEQEDYDMMGDDFSNFGDRRLWHTKIDIRNLSSI